jgi:hypothetical protein
MRPQVEGLESLVFLSVAGVANPALAERIAAARQAAALGAARPASSGQDLTSPDLSGSARGNYRLELAADGSSGSFEIQGIGSVRGLGPARISAIYAASQSNSPDTMSVSLATRRGTLTLRVARAPGDVDPDASTARLRYQVVSGTGSLAQATGTGILDLTLRPQARTLGTTGQMNLTLRPDSA